jgi:hypothetical protein
MPDGVINKADVLAQSYVPEGLPPIASLTPEQLASRKVAQGFRENLAKNADKPLAALERTHGTHEAFHIEESLKNKFGSEIHPADDPTTPEGERLSKAEKAAKIAERFSQKDGGLSELSVDEQTILKEQVILSVLDTRPAFRDLDPTEKEAIATDLLSNPELQAKVGELLKGRLRAGVGEDPRLLEALRAANTKKIEAERVHAEKVRVVESKTAEKKDVEAQIKRFAEAKDDGSESSRREAGDLRKKMDFLAGTEVADQARLDVLKEDPLIKLSDPRTIQVELAEALKKSAREGEESLTPHQRMIIEYGTLQTNIQELQALRNTFEQLKEKRRLLNEQIATAKGEVTVADAAKAAAEAQVDRARDAKAAREDEVVSSLDGLIVDATEGFMREDIVKRDRAYEAGIKEKYAQSTDRMDQILSGKVLSRWDKTEVNGKETRRTIHKDRVNTDLNLLYTPGGDQYILRRMLTEDILTRFPGDTDEAKAAREQETALIEQKMADKAFVDKWTGEIASRVLTKKLQTGEKMHDGDIRRMLDFSWGEQALNTAITNKTNLAEKLDRIKDIAGNPSRLDKLKRIYGNNWVAILALWLALPIGDFVIDRKIKEEGAAAA